MDKEDKQEFRSAVWFGFKWFLLGLVVLLIIGGIVVLATDAFGILHKDVQREVTQHTQAYTETKTALLNKLYNDWLQLDQEIIDDRVIGPGAKDIIAAKQAQQKAIVERMRYEASLIPESEVPDYIRNFIATH